jgi:hypothetical protein
MKAILYLELRPSPAMLRLAQTFSTAETAATLAEATLRVDSVLAWPSPRTAPTRSVRPAVFLPDESGRRAET